MWRAACLSLGAEGALYVPATPPSIYGQSSAHGSMTWKRFFFDNLWPARNKWGDDADAPGEFWFGVWVVWFRSVRFGSVRVSQPPRGNGNLVWQEMWLPTPRPQE